MCVDANVTRLILTVINCDPFEVFFIAIDGLKAREMRFRKYRRVFHTVKDHLRESLNLTKLPAGGTPTV